MADTYDTHSQDGSTEYKTETKEEGLVVSLKAYELGNVAGVPITNSLVSSLVGSVLLVVLLYIFYKNLKTIPGRVQSLFELAVDKGYEFTLTTLEGREDVARKTFPLVISLFLFILFFNLIKFIPGYESTYFNGVHLFKPLHADLNMTLALGITAFIFVQFVGIYTIGFTKYFSKFINLKKPLTIPLGLIELISEFSKMFSLSFRLFGNIFAGGILLLLAGKLSHYVIPVPVMMFEIAVAFLQAGIFSLLTIVYVKLATDEPH